MTDASSPTSARPSLLRLHPDDEIVVATRDLGPGPHLVSDGDVIEVGESVRLGHKVSARALRAGERVHRYGVPIGSMSADAARGDWVHTHNLASDYIATYAHRGGVR